MVGTKFIESRTADRAEAAAGQAERRPDRRAGKESHQRLSRRPDHARPQERHARGVDRPAGRRPRPVPRPGRAGARRRRRAVSARGQRVERVQAGRHRATWRSRSKSPTRTRTMHAVNLTPACRHVLGRPARALGGVGRAGRADRGPVAVDPHALGPVAAAGQVRRAVAVGPLLLAIYMTTVNIVTATVGSPDGKASKWRSSTSRRRRRQPSTESLDAGAVGIASPIRRWTTTPSTRLPDLSPALRAAVPSRRAASVTTPSTARRAAVPHKLPDVPPVEEAGPPADCDRDERSPATAPTPRSPSRSRCPADEPKDSRRRAAARTAASQPSTRTSTARRRGPARPRAPTRPTSQGDAPPSAPQLPAAPTSEADKPGEAQGHARGLQAARRRSRASGQGIGATQESEAAVHAALKWLAANQSASGRWEPRHTGAGSGKAADGQDASAPARRPTPASPGLALLAFLAAGHTHLRRPAPGHRAPRTRVPARHAGRRRQLGASKTCTRRCTATPWPPARSSEAYAMSRDERLQAAVRRRHWLHLRRPGPRERRLALSPQRPGRHQPTRLASHGA